jgi:hypothetical protein
LIRHPLIIAPFAAQRQALLTERLPPEQVFAEYTAHTKTARTGRILHHLFAGRLVANKGKITLLRESLNTVAAAQALNPNGVADLLPPESEIFSVPPDYLS